MSRFIFTTLISLFIGSTLISLAGCADGGSGYRSDDSEFTPTKTWRDSRTFSRHTGSGSGNFTADEIIIGGVGR